MDIFLIDALKTRVLFHPPYKSSHRVRILKIFFSSRFLFNLQKKTVLRVEISQRSNTLTNIVESFSNFPRALPHLTKTMFPTFARERVPYFTIGFRDFRRETTNETSKISRHDMSGSRTKSGDVLSIAERRERKYERKINDPASTLIIPIHKAWYPDTSATSGLIKNDDREGRKLQAAYRPINSTSARPATVSSPRPPLLARPPFRFHLVSFSSTVVAKKKTCVIIANFQLNFPLTTIYDRINRLPGRQTPPIVFTSLLISPRVHDTFVILFPFFFFGLT